METHQVPVGCVCSGAEWTPPLPEVCGEFVPDRIFDTAINPPCANCEHDEACHSEEAK